MTKKELEARVKELERERDTWREIANTLSRQGVSPSILPFPTPPQNPNILLPQPQVIPYQPWQPFQPFNPGDVYITTTSDRTDISDLTYFRETYPCPDNTFRVRTTCSQSPTPPISMH